MLQSCVLLNSLYILSIQVLLNTLYILSIQVLLNSLYILSTQVLLNNGAEVDATFATLNTTALMTSAFHGHTDIVRLLLSRGADVTILDMQQSTALGYAFGGEFR